MGIPFQLNVMDVGVGLVGPIDVKRYLLARKIFRAQAELGQDLFMRNALSAVSLLEPGFGAVERLVSSSVRGSSSAGAAAIDRATGAMAMDSRNQTAVVTIEGSS